MYRIHLPSYHRLVNMDTLSSVFHKLLPVVFTFYPIHLVYSCCSHRVGLMDSLHIHCFPRETCAPTQNKHSKRESSNIFWLVVSSQLLGKLKSSKAPTSIPKKDLTMMHKSTVLGTHEGLMSSPTRRAKTNCFLIGKRCKLNWTLSIFYKHLYTDGCNMTN